MAAYRVPFALSYGLHAQETRPKGQTLRVEQGVAVERAPPVRLRDTLGGGGAEPSPSGPSSAASAGRRGPSATGGGFGPWTTSAGAAGWGATSSAVGLGATGGVAGAAAGDAKVPAFVEHAGRTLTFEAWYGESVAESAIESMRIRKVNLVYYLEDDTLAVTEPQVLNSGLPQQKVLRRHRVPRSALSSEVDVVTLPGMAPRDFVTWRDLRVGSSMPLYGKVYTIYACSDATRRWYEERDAAAGGTGDLEQVPNETAPADGYTDAKRAAMMRETGMDHDVFRGRTLSPVKRYMEASRGNPSAVITRGVKDKTAQWREHDPREVLRFYGLVDETGLPGGGLKFRVRVHLYLADDHVEVIQMRSPMDGMGRFSLLWRKSRLPRSVIYHDSRSRDIESDKGEDDYIGIDDLAVGRTLELMGRKVLLYDADEKTYDWYAANRGLDMRPSKVDVSDPVVEPPEVTPPPWNGYGTEEDSLNSFFSLIPKRPRKDWAKIWAHDGQVLRYHARLAEPRTVPDADREFTVSFFLDTDSLAIFEPPKTNSGQLSGKFLAKTRLRNPEQERFFTADDFYAGAVINVNGHLFKLDAPDKRTAELLESKRKEEAAADAAEARAAAAPPVVAAPSGRVGAARR